MNERTGLKVVRLAGAMFALAWVIGIVAVVVVLL